jgi:hypothetical protein
LLQIQDAKRTDGTSSSLDFLNIAEQRALFPKDPLETISYSSDDITQALCSHFIQYGISAA